MEDGTFTAPRRIPAYSATPPHPLKGYFPQGARLQVYEDVEPDFLRVRFRPSRGNVLEALCKRSDLMPGKPAAPTVQLIPFIAAPPGREYKERDWLEDRDGHDQAMKLQSKYDIPLLIYFYTDWNKECELAEEELLDTTEFKNKSKHIIKLKINPEHGKAEGKLAAKYRLRSYPTTFVIDRPHAKPRKIQLVRRVFGRFKPDDVETALLKITIVAQEQKAAATNQVAAVRNEESVAEAEEESIVILEH